MSLYEGHFIALSSQNRNYKVDESTHTTYGCSIFLMLELRDLLVKFHIYYNHAVTIASQSGLVAPNFMCG